MTTRARKLAALYAATTVAIALIAIDPAWFYIAAFIAALVTVAVLLTQRDEARIALIRLQSSASVGQLLRLRRQIKALNDEATELHLLLTEAQGIAADAVTAAERSHLRVVREPSDYDWPNT